ncbi:MAG: NAD(+) diphosphatase [Chloroflexota bacterium]|jgi:NAD+ diphosphatase
MAYKAAVTPSIQDGQKSLWFAYLGFRLLVRIDGGTAEVPRLRDLSDLGLQSVRQQYLGELDDQPCFSAELVEDTTAPDGWSFQGLRRLYNLLPDELFWVAGAAVQIVDWDRNHQYCGHCGAETKDKKGERAKECPQCGLISYPRISPAIIVLVEKDDTLLLARSHRHPSSMYSVLAGFVEPGETLEAAVAREIREEVGIEVKDIRYFGSQPWPFPNSLMIAFTCQYKDGEIVLEEEEMADADWYKPDELPLIPPEISIARQLIDWFVAGHT